MNPNDPPPHKDADIHGDDPHLMLEVAAMTEEEKEETRAHLRKLRAVFREAGRVAGLHGGDEPAAVSTSEDC